MKYLFIHKKYFYNILTFFCLLLVMLVSIIIIGIIIFKYNPDNTFFYQEEVLKEIINSILVYIKLVIIFWLSYVWGNFFAKENNSYHLLINNYNKNRRIFLNTKIILLFLNNLVVFCLLFFVSIIVIKIYLPFLFDIKKIGILFLNCFGISLTYGFIGIIFILLIPHSYAAIIPSFFFAFCQIIESNEKANLFDKAFLLFFPNVVEVNGSVMSSYGIYHLFIICGIYYSIIILLYNIIKK